MESIRRAIKILKQGGVVIFPTDTAFGIGCRMDDESVVKRVFEIRKRPENQAVPVLVESIEMAQRYLKPIPKDVRKDLMEKYWPGGLTIILPCLEEKVPGLVRGNKNTLGVRMPDHDPVLQVIKELGVPIIAPSANFSGERTPYNLSEVNKDLIDLVDFVLPGVCKIKEQSTVIDCSVEPWKIIRQGAVQLSI
ncbi:threonylcarbamoyl-AMP synthase [Candidatus Parcubacteria bacterium]|nr:MAG: threonylcarbamoyl-AMP synthase [Candidatus Parcubacteria bacterium]